MDSQDPRTDIADRILVIRGLRVMIDRDLAELYGVSTKVLNQTVKRNGWRFPASFTFRLTRRETEGLVTNCDRFASLKRLALTHAEFRRRLHQLERRIDTQDDRIKGFVEALERLLSSEDEERPLIGFRPWVHAPW